MEDNNLLITVITVCYNSEKYITSTLESVLAQTYTNLEYIIIDGQSTDRTLEIIEEYRSKFGGRMRFISEPDRGIYDAMNKGIKMAKGTLIGIINSDDWYEGDAVETIVKNYNASEKYQILYGVQRIIKNGRELQCWYYNYEFLESQMITHPTCFVTKAVYDDLGMFDLQYKSAADYDFMLRMFYNGMVKFIPVFHIIANFRLGGISGSNIGAIETAQIRKKYHIISICQYLKILLINKAKLLIKSLPVYKMIKAKI